MLMASGIPIVETWDFTDTPIDMLVGLRHEALGAAVCEHLFAKGRRHLALKFVRHAADRFWHLVETMAAAPSAAT